MASGPDDEVSKMGPGWGQGSSRGGEMCHHYHPLIICELCKHVPCPSPQTGSPAQDRPRQAKWDTLSDWLFTFFQPIIEPVTQLSAPRIPYAGFGTCDCLADQNNRHTFWSVHMCTGSRGSWLAYRPKRQTRRHIFWSVRMTEPVSQSLVVGGAVH